MYPLSLASDPIKTFFEKLFLKISDVFYHSQTFYWLYFRNLTHDIDLGFSRSNFEITVSHEYLV